jgi:hypothetical protein
MGTSRCGADQLHKRAITSAHCSATEMAVLSTRRLCRNRNSQYQMSGCTRFLISRIAKSSSSRHCSGLWARDCTAPAQVACVGPAGTIAHLAALRHLFGWAYPTVNVLEFSDMDSGDVAYEDDLVQVFALTNPAVGWAPPSEGAESVSQPALKPDACTEWQGAGQDVGQLREGASNGGECMPWSAQQQAELRMCSTVRQVSTSGGSGGSISSSGSESDEGGAGSNEQSSVRLSSVR